MTIAVPIKVGPKRIIGVVSAELNLKFLWRMIGEVRFGKAGYAYVVDDHGTIIAHRDASLVLKKTSYHHLRMMLKSQHHLGSKDPFAQDHRAPGIMGKPVTMAISRAREIGLAVIVEEPMDAALADVRRVERYAFLLLAIGLRPRPSRASRGWAIRNKGSMPSFY